MALRLIGAESVATRRIKGGDAVIHRLNLQDG